MFPVREKSSPAHFGPFSVKICLFLGQNQHLSLYLPNGSLNFADFWFLAIASGTYKFTSVRTSVRASVRPSEISESVHRNFLKYGTKLGLPNATEVIFLDFTRKILFGPFWANLDPKMPFQPKNGHFGQFLGNES